MDPQRQQVLLASPHVIANTPTRPGADIVFTVDPPVVQNCVGPYGNAFHGVRPVFRMDGDCGNIDLEPDWLAAVQGRDAAKLPAIALRTNPNLAFCHLCAYEREARLQILRDALGERDRIYPASLLDGETTIRHEIEDCFNWELTEMAWNFVNGISRRGKKKSSLFRGNPIAVKVVTPLTNVVHFENDPGMTAFSALPGANTLYWAAKQISARSERDKGRSLTSIRFLCHGEACNPRNFFLSAGERLQFIDYVCAVSFGYLINVDRWPSDVRKSPFPLFWECLWDEPRSGEWLQLIAVPSNFVVFDEPNLHSHRDEDRFLKTISPLTPEEFHWRARCLGPGAGCVWSPETDKYWPMLFRKIIRYCLQIRVAAGVAGVGHLPHGIVSIIGSFL